MRAFSTKVPRGAAARAAAIRSAASSMPNSPPATASSRLAPTAPSSTARATVRPTSSGGVAVPGLEIRGHRNAHRGHDAADVLEHRVAVQRPAVRDPARPRDARAGRGDGREADLLEDAGGPGIPGVREHEAGTGVQGEEGGGLVGRGSGGHPHIISDREPPRQPPTCGSRAGSGAVTATRARPRRCPSPRGPRAAGCRRT